MGDGRCLDRSGGDGRDAFQRRVVTKPFTAAVVMQLVDEGTLELDDPVIRHLPSLPYQYAEITVRQLLTHTSGIARDLRLDNLDDPDRATFEARLDTASASSAPGTRFEYSNTGYAVLGWLVSAVEGEPLERVMQRRLFEPAEMLQARYRASPSEDPLRALPHAVDEGEPRPIDYITGGFGSGGLSMSIADAAAFGLALQRGDFLPAGLADTVWISMHPTGGRPGSTAGRLSTGFGSDPKPGGADEEADTSSLR